MGKIGRIFETAPWLGKKDYIKEREKCFFKSMVTAH